MSNEKLNKKLLDEEKARLDKTSREIAQWLVEFLDERIAVAVGYGLDIRKSEKFLERAKGAVEDERFDRAMGCCRDGLKIIEEEIKAGSNGLILHGQAHGLYEQAKIAKIDTEIVQRLLDQAREARSGKSRIYYYEQVISNLEKELGLTEQLYELVDLVNIRMEEARSLGRDIKEAEELFVKAKMATQHESAIHFLKKCLGILEG